jgi:hypothetical protein
VKSFLCHAFGIPFRWFGTNDAAVGHNLIVEGWPTTHSENTTSGNHGAYTGQIRSLKLQRTIMEEMRLFQVLRPPRKGTLRRSSTLLRSSRPPPLKLRSLKIITRLLPNI